MCGIVGFVHFDAYRKASRQTVEAMTNALAHRGPDGQGAWTDGAVGLGHRRLSIIDLSQGRQPMRSEKHRLVITFNGEIYNYKKLRAQLETQGFAHQSQSDTETLLLLFAAQRDRAFSQLNGMFSFAVWDETNQNLTVARDPAGQKPFYWTVFDDSLLFASEPKALFCYPGFKARLNVDAMSTYLAYDYVPSPNTIYEGIYKLPAGHWFKFAPFNQPSISSGARAVDAKPYWKIPVESSGSLTQSSARGLLQLLEDSIERHLVSDVPIGVFLSGGLDSSAIAALVSRSSARAMTFTIGFSDPSFDESKIAGKVAAQLGTDHQVEVIKSDDAIELALEVDQWLDEPFGDASILPTYLLSKFASRFVKVALGGDGADELWAGYPTYHAHRHFRFYQRLPLFMRKRLVEPLVRSLPVSYDNFSFDFKAKKFLDGAESPFPLNHQLWLGSFHAGDVGKLLIPTARSRTTNEELFVEALARFPSNKLAPLRSALELDFLLYLADDILFKTDRAGMANSLEIRAPFLDTELMRFSFELPDHAKMSGSKSKALLRAALKGIVPKEVLRRPKKGFGIPSARWFRGPLRKTLRESLNTLAESGLFNIAELNEIENSHFHGKRDERKRLWTLFALGRWMKRWNPIV